MIDQVSNYVLLALSFFDDVPHFRDLAKKETISSQELTIYYTRQCPFTNHCIEELRNYQQGKKIPITFICVDTLEKAKNMPCVFQNWATFQNGKFLSHTLLNKNMVAKLYEEKEASH